MNKETQKVIGLVEANLDHMLNVNLELTNRRYILASS